jgi:hypothetical protein
MNTTTLHPGTEMAPALDRARQLFFDDPSLSISEAARTLSNQRLGVATDVLSRIRTEVRQKIQNLHEKPKWVEPLIRRQPRPEPAKVVAPFNPPRLVLAQKPEPEVKPEPEPVEPEPAPKQEVSAPAPEPAPEIKVEETTETRRRWLEDWMLDHPKASVNKARDALRDHFGRTLSTTAIAEVVRIVHDSAGLVPKPVQRPEPEQSSLLPYAAQVADVIHRARYLGIRKLELVDGGHYEVDLLETRH